MLYITSMARDIPWHHIIPEPNSGCWLWDGRYSKSGYGTLGGGRKGERVQAHRLMWEAVNGPIPGGLLVCHRCDVRGCVNPDHLFVGTAKDNTRDMMVKGRARFPGGLHNSLKTHCKYGHPFIEGRISIVNGSRVCLECARLAAQERRALIAEGLHDIDPDHRNAQKTHCRFGHPYDEKNTRFSAGARQCRECDRLRAQIRRALRKGHVT